MDYQQENKKNLSKWLSALEFLAKELNENKIPYYLSASGLSYILEEKVYPYDIDLFISKEDIKKAFDLLKPYTTSPIHKWKNKYLEFQGEYNQIKFEICEWERKPEKLEIKKFRNLEVSLIG